MMQETKRYYGIANPGNSNEFNLTMQNLSQKLEDSSTSENQLMQYITSIDYKGKNII